MDKPKTSIDTIAKTCIAVRLRLMNRVVTNFYDDALRPLGLKVSQLNILIVTAELRARTPHPDWRDPATRQVHPQSQPRTDAGARVAGGRSRGGCSCPTLPADISGETVDREGNTSLGASPASSRRTAWG